MWSRDLSHLDRMKQQKIVDELSSKAQSSGNCRKQKKDEACQTGNNKASASLIPVLSSPVPKHGINYKDPNEDEKKAPILVWINHAVVEMPDEYFDGEHVYTWNHLEYVRVHGSVAEPIKIHRGKFGNCYRTFDLILNKIFRIQHCNGSCSKSTTFDARFLWL